MTDAKLLAAQVKDGSLSEEEARRMLVKMYSTMCIFMAVMEAFSKAL
jgi:hypothetical protein